uniref:PCNA-interacting partner n=1 Tax=Salmo trutta TaxID=8032 RepID=A0A673ZRG0_SALTR
KYVFNEDSLKTVVRTFRRECLRVLESERTNIHGADGMLMVLQLAIAEVNKQESGEFSVALSDVQMAWKHLLLDKLHLPLYNDSSRPENYDIIRKEYDSFLKRTNTMDLIDIHSMYKQRWFGQNIKCYIGSYRCATKVLSFTVPFRFPSQPGKPFILS